MGIVSYAQNFEDVLLWRALGHIRQGCYIDIGAHDPVVDSVSKAFYEHGWRGIHLEPLPVYCNALRQDRPDETVLQAAVAAETGVLRFYEIPDTGISTGDEAIARSHRERGFPINEITVPCVTLAQVFDLVEGDVVHWLKIDVEGLEEQVLRGWGESALRPWIVVVESTLPLTQDEVFSAWEGLLTEKGYRCVHFDGLNRYYLAEEQRVLEEAFRSGPNVFDGFQFNGTATNTFTQHVSQSLRNELGSQIELLKQQVLQHQEGEHDSAARLAEALQRSESLKQALLAEQTANLQNQNAAKALALQFGQQARLESDAQLRSAMQREQVFTEQLLAGKEQLQQLANEHAIREFSLREQLVQATHQFRLESEAHLRNAVEREQAVAAQQLALQHQAAQALAQQARELQLQHDERRLAWETQEKALRQEVSNLTNEVQALRHANELQIQQHGFVMDAQLSEHQRLLEAYAALESCFKAEIGRSWWWRMIHPFSHWGTSYYGCSLDYSRGVFGGGQNPLRESKMFGNHNLKLPVVELTNKPAYRQSVTPNTYVEGESMTLNELLSKPQEVFIRSAYRAILGRDADCAGFEHYSAMLILGASRTSILYSLYNSKEAKATLGPYRDLASLDNAHFLESIYQRLLGRSPDAEGRSHYLARLRTQSGRQGIIRDIELSAEAYKLNPQRGAFRRQLEELLRTEKKNQGWRGWLLRNKRIDARLNQTKELIISLSAQVGIMHAQISHELTKESITSVSVERQDLAVDSYQEEVSGNRVNRYMEIHQGVTLPSVFETVKNMKVDSPDVFFSDLASALAASREANLFVSN